MMHQNKTGTFITLAGLAGLIILMVVLFIQAGTEEAPEPEPRKPYLVTGVPIPDNLEFAGEPVPLDHFDVRESLDRELLVNTYWQSHTVLLIKRAHRYFPTIEKILKEEGIPEDFKYLAVAESDLMNLRSPAGAVGFWQFRKATALEEGLEVNREVDERYHLEKSTRAAAGFLKHSHGLYDNWTLAAASYNMGRTGLNRQMGRQQNRYYYDLLLNQETGRYVYRLLALKLILSNPAAYGFELEKDELYSNIPVRKVKVSGPVDNFAEFAATHGTNYKVLKIFNPWLRDNHLSNTRGRTYEISIPKKGWRSLSMIESE